MRVLLLHNRYREPGGEDAVVRSEADLLRAHAVEVREAAFDNESAGSPLRDAVELGLHSAWSRRSYDAVRKLCAEFRPDVVHVHNFWMRLTPSVHAAARDFGAPTVQTLHNYRLLCASALLYRNGEACEDCVGKSPWRGVARRCYRDSALASAAVAALMVVNRARGTWEREVKAFIALSHHSRARFVAGGLPGELIFVKPNFVPDSGPGPAPSDSRTVLYAGRLSPEKGVATLVGAWAAGALHRFGRLVIAGDGPERAMLERTAAHRGAQHVEFAGRCEPARVAELIRSSRAIVVPSLCYENFPRIVVEGFMAGRPAIVSATGALQEIVHGRVGVRFRTGDADDLARALESVLANGALADRLGEEARREYLGRYTPEHNFTRLMHIYRFASA